MWKRQFGFSVSGRCVIPPRKASTKSVRESQPSVKRDHSAATPKFVMNSNSDCQRPRRRPPRSPSSSVHGTYFQNPGKNEGSFLNLFPIPLSSCPWPADLSERNRTEWKRKNRSMEGERERDSGQATPPHRALKIIFSRGAVLAPG